MNGIGRIYCDCAVRLISGLVSQSNPIPDIHVKEG